MTSPAIAERIVPRISNFKFGKEIGHGAFSTVYAAIENSSGNEFAMKVAVKQHIKRNRAVDSVLMEKEALRRVSHPFVIRLHYTFQDDTRLFYVLELAHLGSFVEQLERFTALSVNCVRFYAAEIFSALTYLHGQSIVHRDLKPDNILLTNQMHVKLADFGSAIILNDPRVRAPGFTGTVQYVSPEMIKSISTSQEPKQVLPELAHLMDYWALGCVIYQLISGKAPFRHDAYSHEYALFEKILSVTFTFENGFDPVAQDLVSRLMVLDSLQRLGSPNNGGPEALRQHSFFSGIDWSGLSESQPPVLEPNLVSLSAYLTRNPPPDSELFQLTDVPLESGQLIIDENERAQLMRLQSEQNPFHRFVSGRLILKQGLLYKRCGIFASRRMFILTEGPRIYYFATDPIEVKGEITCSAALTACLATDLSPSFFFLRLPSRTWLLEDPAGGAGQWVAYIDAVKQIYFPSKSVSCSSTTEAVASASSDNCS